jgi:hypothetical protein
MVGAVIQGANHHTMPHNSTSDVVFLHAHTGHNVQCVTPQGQAHCVNANKGAYEEVRIKHHNGSFYIQSVRNGNNLQCPPDCRVKFENKNEGAWEAWDIEHQGDKVFFVSKHTKKVLQCTPSGELKCDNHNRMAYETFHILHRDGNKCAMPPLPSRSLSLTLARSLSCALSLSLSLALIDLARNGAVGKGRAASCRCISKVARVRSSAHTYLCRSASRARAFRCQIRLVFDQGSLLHLHPC